MKPDSSRFLAPGARCVRVALLGAALTALTALAALPAAAAPAAEGAAASQAQFGGQCTEGLAEGRHIQTNCAITWTDKDGKVYCFSSEGSKKSFLANPSGNLQKARDFLAAGKTLSTEQAMQNYDSGDAETVVKRHIEATLKANNGVFPLEDPADGAQLKLIFDGIDFTRTIDGYGFFPDVKFHDQGDAAKRWLIDFWVAPANGQLKVEETRIYKEPAKGDNGAWTMTARDPIPWWWIPASEHPGHVAFKRGWEVMSAVEQGALREQARSNGVFKLKDDKTGKTLDLEFIDTHQPIRQLDNGHYFACTDFRAAGTKDQIYDIDFWIEDKNGTMTVTQTKVHKVPELKDGKWVEVPRYSWKDLGNSKVVP